MFTSRNQNKLHCNFELVCNKNWRARMVLPGVSKALISAVLHVGPAIITCFFFKRWIQISLIITLGFTE